MELEFIFFNKRNWIWNWNLFFLINEIGFGLGDRWRSGDRCCCCEFAIAGCNLVRPDRLDREKLKLADELLKVELEDPEEKVQDDVINTIIEKH